MMTLSKAGLYRATGQGAGAILEVGTLDQPTWQRISRPFDDLSLMQVWAFAQAKTATGHARPIHHLLRYRGKIIGAAQGICYGLPLVGPLVVWVNRGPLWREQDQAGDPNHLTAFLLALHDYWTVRHRALLRIAPPIPDHPDNLALMASCGYVAMPGNQWVSTRIDLAQSIEALRANLNQKWRNCLNKAERLALGLEIGETARLTAILLKDYKHFLIEKRYATSVKPELIAQLQDRLAPDQKMVILSADTGGQHLGSILIAGYGSVAEYLVGAIGADGKRHNAGQFLLWHALVEMKRRGYRWFDVGGAHPQHTPPGILHFKKGLSGRPYRLAGTFQASRSLVSRLLCRVLSRK